MTAPTKNGATGYLHRSYAESFSAFSTPRELGASGGWVLERSIPDSSLRDAMGCYPIFACRDWRRLEQDLTQLADDVVSLSLVTDPFGNFDETDLDRSFDLVRPFKQHFVTDLSGRPEDSLPRRHRRNIASARDQVQLEICAEPSEYLDEWCDLYAQLVKRHGITGMRAFSRDAFARQLDVPGLVLLRASAKGRAIGLHLWYLQGDVAYGHLGATSALGYELMASYALYAYAIEQFRSRVRWLHLGAAAGLGEGEAERGLRLFKEGWSTGTRPAYLCGRIFQAEAYSELVRQRGGANGAYFPAYRAGEFDPARAETR